MEQKKIMINFDESIVDGTTSQRKRWTPKGIYTGRHYKSTVSGLSIMLAVSSIGDVFFFFLDGNNNESTVATFLIQLEAKLSRFRPNWRDTHVLLLDNCSSHKTPLVRNLICSL